MKLKRNILHLLWDAHWEFCLHFHCLNSQISLMCFMFVLIAPHSLTWMLRSLSIQVCFSTKLWSSQEWTCQRTHPQVRLNQSCIWTNQNASGSMSEMLGVGDEARTSTNIWWWLQVTCERFFMCHRAAQGPVQTLFRPSGAGVTLPSSLWLCFLHKSLWLCLLTALFQ